MIDDLIEAVVDIGAFLLAKRKRKRADTSPQVALPDLGPILRPKQPEEKSVFNFLCDKEALEERRKREADERHEEYLRIKQRAEAEALPQIAYSETDEAAPQKAMPPKANAWTVRNPMSATGRWEAQ